MSEYNISYRKIGTKKTKEDSTNAFAVRKIFFTLFAILLFGSSFLSMLNISFTSFFSMNEMTFEIGFPFTYLRIGFGENNQGPLDIGGLILDILIYALFSYAINVVVNLVKESISKNPNELAKEIKVPKKIN